MTRRHNDVVTAIPGSRHR